MPELIAGIGELADRFDGFIVDQWGVLHNGIRAYPGAVDCLRQLRERGKLVAILSNSGRRSDANRQQMAEMGFDACLYDAMVTAGEDARQAIAQRADPFYARLGTRCFAISRDGERSVLEGVGLTFVEDVGSADFIFVISMDSPRRLLADYEAQLQLGVTRGLKLVCANPDFQRVTEAGTTEAPGVLARRYEELGGSVRWHGKPHRPIYDSCLRTLGDIAPDRVVAVGDSIEHDIVGANAAGIAGALIGGGIHAAQLGIGWGAMPSRPVLQAFLASAPAMPGFVVPVFTWEGAPQGRAHAAV